MLRETYVGQEHNFFNQINILKFFLHFCIKCFNSLKPSLEKVYGNFIKSIPNVLHVGQSTHHFSPDMVGRKKQTQDKNFFIC